MKKAQLLLLVLTISGCNKDEDFPKAITLPDSYYFGYMDYPFLNVAPQPGEQLISLEYENGKVIKRTGDLLNISSNSGYQYTFTEDLFDSLIYSGNQIVIEKKASASLGVTPFHKRTITLDANNHMLRKISQTANFIATDTTDYEYNPSRKLVRSISYGLNHLLEKTYYYNDHQNLDSIVSRELSPNPGILEAHMVEIFGEYDQAENPIRELMFFEELFNRSLSANNYTYYENKIYHPESHFVILSYERAWTLMYNEGQVCFDCY